MISFSIDHNITTNNRPQSDGLPLREKNKWQYKFDVGIYLWILQ